MMGPNCPYQNNAQWRCSVCANSARFKSDTRGTKETSTNKQANKHKQNQSKQWWRDGRLRHLREFNNETIKSEGTQEQEAGRGYTTTSRLGRSKRAVRSMLVIARQCTHGDGQRGVAGSKVWKSQNKVQAFGSDSDSDPIIFYTNKTPQNQTNSDCQTRLLIYTTTRRVTERGWL